MMTIWKYPLGGASEQEILLPRGCKALSVGFQLGVPSLWVLCSDKAILTPRKVSILFTGAYANDVLNMDFVGTLIEGHPSYLVYHVFIDREEKEIL